jgi:hypothetical protein
MVLSPHGLAQQSTNLSNIFTVDTRTGVLIRGIVLDGSSPSGPFIPLPGASVTIGTSSTTSDSRGAFEIKTPLASAQAATISMQDFATWTKSLNPKTDATSLDLGSIILRKDNKPVIQSVELTPDDCFLADRGLQAQLTVTINWLSFTPLRVELREGSRLIASSPTTDILTTFPLDIDATFPGGSPRAHNLSVTAIATSPDGEIISLPVEQPLRVFPWPAFLQPLKSQAVSNGQNIALDFSLTTREQNVTLPVIGPLGCEFRLGSSFDYDLTDGSWETALGSSISSSIGKRSRRPRIPGFTSYDRPLLHIGNRDIELDMFARSAGNALPGTGIRVNDITGDMTLSARMELARYGLLDLIGPGLSTSARNIAGEDFVRNFSVRVDALPDISGQAAFAPRWPLTFKDATMDLSMALQAVYQPSLTGKSARVVLGGHATANFGLPEPIFRNVDFKGYAGLEVNVWPFSFNAEYVFLDYTFQGRRLPAGSFPIQGGMLLAATSNPADWHLRERNWRNSGPEKFLPLASGPGRRIDAAQPANLTALEQFNRMGAAPSPGAVFLPPPNGPGRRLISDPTLPAGAALPLLANVYPGSSPSLAARRSDLMLLYVRDTDAANPAQYTEIAWTRYDGTSWTTPQALASHPAAQFHPQVAYAANGDALAIFERIKDPAYSGNDLPTYAGLMEICWSRWNQTSQTWSAPLALTANPILDFEPRLEGPLADGSIVACWRESTAGKLDASPSAPQRLMSARWTPGGGTWTAPVALLDADEGLLAFDISASADKAVVTWCLDGDRDAATTNDTEIFYRILNVGAWSPATALTTDALPDRNPRIWIDATGNVSLAWNRNGAMVLSRNFATPSAIHDTAAGLKVEDYSLTGGPGGNLVLIWQDMGENGSDTFYRVYDPTSTTWSKNMRMSSDSDVEQDFSAVWDAAGNLTIAYNNSPVTMKSVSVPTQGAGSVQVENVPHSGPMSLLLAKQALVRDLAIVPGSLKASGLGFTPGEVLNVTCEIANTGHVAVNAPVVAFFIGDPDINGVQIHRRTLPGWLAAAETRQVTFSWTIPAPTPSRVLHVLLDPGRSVTEFTESNNSASFTLGGPDLKVEATRITAMRDGALRMLATVSNIGNAPSPVSSLTLLQNAQTPVMLEAAPVPQLEAGTSTELIFNLPPATQPEGEGFYRLIVDADALSGDTDPLNNSAALTAILWIDDDADKLPRWWELANGLSDSNPLDGTGDRDGDGFTDAGEYLAGTNPRNGSDFLKIGAFHTTSIAPDNTNRQISFSWASVAGSVYDVQRSFSLSGAWETIASNIPATPPLNSCIDTLSSDQPRAFYRLHAK